MKRVEFFNKLRIILIDMGNPWYFINEETNLEKDLGFDYLDIADFTVRIENEFNIQIDINIYPDVKYRQFENIGSAIDFLSKEYNII